MFSSITWNDFLFYASSSIIIYYAISIPWLYRHEIKRRLKNRNAPSSQDPSADFGNEGNAMQLQRLQRIAERIEEEDEPVLTATITPLTSQENIPNNDTRNINLISALMLEANTLASVIAGSQGGMEDINSMFRSVLEHYSELLASPYASSINVFLLNACVKEGLPVSASQVESWWTQSTTTSE